MNVSIGIKLEGFVEQAVASGRYALSALRQQVEASIADPRASVSDNAVEQHLQARSASSF